MTEDRGQNTDVRGQKAENGLKRYLNAEFGMGNGENERLRAQS